MAISFKEKVYRAVWKIPKGETRTYKYIAKTAGSPQAFRAVGNILNKHKISGLPCHRVIKSSGEIGGYFWGTSKKKSLLKKEGFLK